MLGPKLILTSICALFFTLNIGCTNRETAVDKGIREQVLHIGNQIEPQDLDPHIITGVPEMNVIAALIEGLVTENPRDLSPEPGAAEKWNVSEDGLRYTFQLRRDGKWSNGDPVTSHDFAYSFRRILSPNLASEYAYMLYCMANAERYHKGETTDFTEVGVETPDSFTIVVTLASPTPYFLSLIVHNSWLPVHPPTIERFGKIDLRGSRWTRPENFVGNGPFVLSQWKTNRIITVKKNPNYWDAGSVRLNGIQFHPIESDQTEERAFRSGQLHVTHSVPLNKIESYRTDSPHLIRIDPYLGTYYYLINISRPPLDNVKVRRALAMAIDRKSIVENVLKGGQLPAHHFTPPNTAGYTADASIPTDFEGARALLAEAGYPNGEGFPAVDILYNTSEAHQIVAQAIQEMWRKHLGINVTLTNQEWKVYLDTQHSKEYDISRAGWIGDYNDPNTFLDMWITGGGNNRTGWSDARYDELIRAAAMTGDPSKRFSLFQEAEKVLMEDASLIPIYFYMSLSLIHPSVKGWHPNILNHHPYKHAYLEEVGR